MPNIATKIMQVASVWSSFFRVITNKLNAGISVASDWKVFLKLVRYAHRIEVQQNGGQPEAQQFAGEHAEHG